MCTCCMFIWLNRDRDPKEKLVNIPVPKLVFNGYLSALDSSDESKDLYTFGNSKEYYRNDIYGSTKKRFLFFLTNLLIKSFTYETIQLETK